MKNFKTIIFNSLLALLTLFLINGTASAQQVELDFGGDLAGRPGDAFTIEVTADLGETEVDNFDFEFEYDTSLVEIDVDSIEAGSIVTGDFQVNEPEMGRIILATYNNSITGENVLFTVKGTFKDSGVNTSGVQFTNINIGDDLAYNVSTPFDIRTSASDVLIALPDVNGSVGSSEELVITTDDLSGLDIYSYELSFTYDSDAISIDGVSADGTVSEGGLLDLGTSATDTAKIAWAGSSAISSNGTDLLKLDVSYLAETSSELEFVKVDFFNSNGDLVVITGVDGSVTVGEGGLIEFTSALPDTVVDAGSTLEYNYMASSESGTITYSILEGPAGATIDASTGAFSWETSEGEYSIVVEATDGTSSVTDTAAVTVAGSAPFSFENGTLGYWYFLDDNNYTTSGEITDDQAYDGDYSVMFTVGSDAANGAFVNDNSEAAPGDTVRFHVYVPASSLSAINGIQPFVQNNGWGWNSNWYGSGNIAADTWVTMDIVVPPSETIERIGLQVDGSGASATPTVYVDMIEIIPGNAAPTFTSVLEESATINEEEEFEFTYEAEDADGEELTFSLVEGPEGASITGGGVFTWTPSETAGDDGDSYTITVEVTDGNSTVSTTVAVMVNNTVSLPIDGTTPKSFALQQNYPNPFNPTTNITYAVPEASTVRLDVFNALGQKVSTLVNEQKGAGNYTVTFDATNLTSGVYFFKIQAGSFTDTKKMLLLK
ncbi:T9SS type A sorting domain-containing protein [Gracilimonas mengyeensis]|uniref:Por secretion system C-terminal sorting domain-containing protein n=1 Tax=Gracilimonas mengyeensis TaxID=1302730 RepID=A0A521BT37_9BACT|nr:T9SS type A sorting domain-containing protein [Gracilimonas mengyeensis]SMO49891.1 Por secretion system C-terminal sorting domain-containing protein [Gracilimonas mengyeensis]